MLTGTKFALPQPWQGPQRVGKFSVPSTGVAQCLAPPGNRTLSACSWGAGSHTVPGLGSFLVPHSAMGLLAVVLLVGHSAWGYLGHVPSLGQLPVTWSRTAFSEPPTVQGSPTGNGAYWQLCVQMCTGSGDSCHCSQQSSLGPVHIWTNSCALFQLPGYHNRGAWRSP